MTSTELIKIRMVEMDVTITELSNATGIKLRTLKRYIATPETMRLSDLRAINCRLRFSPEQLAKLCRG